MKKVWLVRKVDNMDRIVNAHIYLFTNEDKAKKVAEEYNKKEFTDCWDYEIFFLNDIELLTNEDIEQGWF